MERVLQLPIYNAAVPGKRENVYLKRDSDVLFQEHDPLYAVSRIRLPDKQALMLSVVI